MPAPVSISVRTAFAAAFLLAALLVWCGSASANRIVMPTLSQTMAHDQQIAAANRAHRAVTPPAPPCPESGQLPAPFSNCGLPEFPATTFPVLGNMSYWGGAVQTHPRVYIVYFGWGQPGAFPGSQTCSPETLTEGTVTATLACDPDGAGKHMADFVSQMGGTQWAGVQTQYYDSAQQHIANDPNVLGGIWADDTNPTSAKITYTDMAMEAQRAVAHFGITDLKDANIVIAQPPNFSDPQALSSGYCAFHDYTQPGLEGGIYNGIQAGIAYTNMPYSLAINQNGANDCGENAVNSGAAGKLDGFSIVLGHEIEETITDPGAEDIIGSGTNATYLGGWYDPVDANENGDKCAWVGESLAPGAVPGAPNVTPVPGAIGDIKGNAGTTFAVQSLWSNQALEGAGYCAGSGTDLPQPVPPPA